MYQIDEALCTGCGTCIAVCPVKAIELRDDRAHVNTALCTACGACADACPQGAILETRRDLALPRLEVLQPTTNQFPTHSTVRELVTAPKRATHSVWRWQVWPAVGAALLWASRELLPELLSAWQASAASRANLGGTGGQILPQSDRIRQGGLAVGWKRGRRHRWGATRRSP